MCVQPPKISGLNPKGKLRYKKDNLYINSVDFSVVFFDDIHTRFIFFFLKVPLEFGPAICGGCSIFLVNNTFVHFLLFYLKH